MALAIECTICMECFDPIKIDKVACGSSVDHMVCFKCEGDWRDKMPLKHGIRRMTCPTCRQEELYLYRTTESLQREVRRTLRKTYESLKREPSSTEAAQIAEEMAQAAQIARDIRCREHAASSAAHPISMV